MTLSGIGHYFLNENMKWVLIPLLVDDPLRASNLEAQSLSMAVLIPLLVDDPLWDHLQSSKLRKY